jgi:hypothetical protein
MAICELDSDDSLCKEAKKDVVRVHLDKVEGLEEHAEYDLVVPVQEARKAFSDHWEAFLHRNRLAEGPDLIYLDKVKKEQDREALLPKARKLYTGWFVLGDLPREVASKLLRLGGEDIVTEWDMISFEEMRETCARCKLSWDKGRGCIGTFGPENSSLPEIARKNGCEIIANIPSYAQNGEKLTPHHAELLMDEVKKLRDRLPEEGKIMVRRYSGVLDRLEEMAHACVDFGTRFYFL